MPIEIISLFMIHFLCNAQASVAPVTPSEAAYCSSNFEKLKITLHPDITWDRYNSMSASDQAKVSVEAYQYYRDWTVEHPDLVARLRSASEAFAILGQDERS